ncbi:MAG: hypothetical protein K5930_12170 [Treponemataceae bacterium]|nr:hypothetical protein [Treponemataceae bacterium]
MKSSRFRTVLIILVFSLMVISLSAESLVVDKEPLRLVVYDYSGAMSLYLRSSKTEEFCPLFVSTNEAYTSGIYLKYGKVSRKLTRSAGIDVSVKEVESGAEVTYNLSGIATVVVRYTILSAVNKDVADCVRVDVSVENIDKYSETFAIKAVFDTCLGENAESHFSTYLSPSINTEYMFQSIKDDKWIKSSDGNESLQFLLQGGDVSSPQYVAVANRDLLLSNEWLPVVTDGRYFDSVWITGNSALGLYWYDVILKAKAKSNFTFYLTTATAGMVPPDVKTVCGNLSEELASLNIYTEPVYTDSRGAKFTVGELSDEQLNPDYIARLLQRIQELGDESESSTYYDEIQRLNGELDAILLKLGEGED